MQNCMLSMMTSNTVLIFYSLSNIQNNSKKILIVKKYIKICNKYTFVSNFTF